MKELIRNEMVECTWKMQNTDLSIVSECGLSRIHFATMFEKEPTDQEQTNAKIVGGQVW